MTEGFRWHPKARLYDSAGQEVPALRPAGPVLPDTPQGIAAAIGHPYFRIGAPDQPAPEPYTQPILETLTSGSTGPPRRIRRTQASWIASFAVNATLGIGPGARVATLGRPVHSLSLYGTIEGLHLGAEVHLLSGLRPDRQRAALAQRHITHLYATPAQLRLLTDRTSACPDLRLVLVGGSKLDAALRAALASLAPNAQIREFYGAAETSFITLADDSTPETSVGRPYPGVDLHLDATGEVWVKSPYLFLDYGPVHICPNIPAGGPSPEPAARPSRAKARQKERASALHSTSATTRWRNGWLSVGEIGALNDAYLVLKGRVGRMVTVADQNVFPEEIEGLLLTLSGITQAAVLPVADAKRGHVLVAILQGDSAAGPAVLRTLRAQLGPLKTPRSLIWRQDWPTLPSGKTDLKALEVSLWPA